MNKLLGEIRLFPYGKIPDGWLECAGQELYITENANLFMLLGAKFGGNGKQKFRLPDLRRQAPENLKYCMAVEGEFPDLFR